MEVFALICRRFNATSALVGVYASKGDAEAAAYELGLAPSHYEVVRLE